MLFRIGTYVYTDTKCVEGTLYLVDGRNMKEGIVLMCSNGEWYTVCGDTWSEVEADVVCSTLHYSAETSQEATRNTYIMYTITLITLFSFNQCQLSSGHK